MKEQELVKKCLLTDREFSEAIKGQKRSEDITDAIQRALLVKATPIIRKAVADEIIEELGQMCPHVFTRRHITYKRDCHFCMEIIKKSYSGKPTGKGEVTNG